MPILLAGKPFVQPSALDLVAAFGADVLPANAADGEAAYEISDGCGGALSLSTFAFHHAVGLELSVDGRKVAKLYVEGCESLRIVGNSLVAETQISSELHELITIIIFPALMVETARLFR